MKGTTELTLTHETMVEALQLYFDQQFAEKHKVLSVSSTGSQYGPKFEVKMDPVVEEPPKKGPLGF